MQRRQVEVVVVVVGIHELARQVAPLMIEQIAQHTNASLACSHGGAADQVPAAASRHTIRLPSRPRSAAKCRSDVRHQLTGWCIVWPSSRNSGPIAAEGY